MDAAILMFYLAVAFLAAYVVGGLHTTRRLGQLSSSLAAELGGKVRRRSGNIAIISGRDLGPAIEDYSVALILLGRANPITWLAAKAAGRRDFLVLRARLKRPPGARALLVRKGTPPFRALRPKGTEIDGCVMSSSDEGLRPLLGDASRLRGLWLLRLSTSLPHLEAVFELRGQGPELAGLLEAVARLLPLPERA